MKRPIMLVVILLLCVSMCGCKESTDNNESQQNITIETINKNTPIQATFNINGYDYCLGMHFYTPLSRLELYGSEIYDEYHDHFNVGPKEVSGFYVLDDTSSRIGIAVFNNQQSSSAFENCLIYQVAFSEEWVSDGADFHVLGGLDLNSTVQDFVDVLGECDVLSKDEGLGLDSYAWYYTDSPSSEIDQVYIHINTYPNTDDVWYIQITYDSLLTK